MLFATLALLLSSAALAAPTDLLTTRATSQCGQYQSQSSGAYTLYTNGWGWSSGTGSQCSQIDSLSGSTLTWTTTWSWTGTANQVKSYTNVETGFTKKQISTYTSIPTTWKWSYVGTDLRVNGMHLHSRFRFQADGYAIRQWRTIPSSAHQPAAATFSKSWYGLESLAVYRPCPNGYPFTPIATVTIGGTIFDLAYGLNGSVKVYSFVARGGAATNFSADFVSFGPGLVKVIGC
jgi:xyloglucan-specific endo-beta-1,4-glucanase